MVGQHMCFPYMSRIFPGSVRFKALKTTDAQDKTTIYILFGGFARIVAATERNKHEIT